MQALIERPASSVYSSASTVNFTKRNGSVACKAIAGTARTKAGASMKSSPAAAELAVLEALRPARGRGKDGLDDAALASLNLAVAVLEADGGVAAPTASPAINGKWRLLYTSRPGTASRIQRTFTGVDAFSVYQEVDLASDQPRVNNIVDFGERVGYLKVEAEASTESRPLEGFTPRRGEGLPFGIMGRSMTYAPPRPDARIDFQFDRAAFHFKPLPFTLPYPVPFRLLGDERKGWIDNTYMNAAGTFRLARGNKGTLFVLARAPAGDAAPLEDQLLDAAAARDDAAVLALVALMSAEPQAARGGPAPARSDAISGTWRLVWSQQAEGASPLQKWGSAQARSLQVIDAEAGTVQNIVDLGFAQLAATATCEPLGDDKTDVFINGATFGAGPLKVPLPVKGTGFVQWLYLSRRVRVTRGSKGSLFVHVREEEEGGE